MKQFVIFCVCLFGLTMHAQTTIERTVEKEFLVTKDSVFIDSVSISPYNFIVFDSIKQVVLPNNYEINFSKALLVLDAKKYPKISVQYQPYPRFLTKTYTVFDSKLIVPKRTDISKLYSLSQPKKNLFYKPFDGLATNGSLSRGLTVGNNQDAVLNSNLDLQISGFLSENVELRASITDTNIPLQEGGYTQRLNEFDRVFIELLSKNWGVMAGDVNLENRERNFLRFNKKVAGVAVNATLNHSEGTTKAHASGAIVRGQFGRNSIMGQEANQGPYRIIGNNIERSLLIISGSETVFVNGIPLKRGENYDYIIDYNTAEITFMPTFPITANMRIIVEYQFSDRNFTRFVTYNGAEYNSDNFKIGINFYNENDAKNQNLQQELTDSQKQILADAGDNQSLMIVPSARAEAYSENKILYRKELIDAVEVFVFSNDENDALFNVQFSYVGEGQGNYGIQTTIATGRIFEYITPVNGVSQGDYEPVIQLIAPNKLQIATLHSSYEPSEKTSIATEFAYSLKDQNLFSNLDDTDNKGFASKLDFRQTILDKKWNIQSSLNYEYVDKDFNVVERLRNVEFNRDWDIVNPQGNQQLFAGALHIKMDSTNHVNYSIQGLRYSENFNGVKHDLSSNFNFNKSILRMNGSILSNTSDLYSTKFLRWYSYAQQQFRKGWMGIRFNTEHNDRKEKTSSISTPLSHKFIEYEAFAGIGDSTKVFVEVGYNYRTTDSVSTGTFQKVNTTDTYYLKSSLLNKKNANLNMYFNYRLINNTLKDNEEAFNSRLVYRQQLFNNGISLNSIYETNSGTIPQQEFNYLEVQPGQGFYTWIDYNLNGIQELDEFEIAQFPDQAIYVRVLLPSVNFIKTHQNKFSQSLTLNPRRWTSKKGLRKFLSNFVNQSFVLIDSEHKREGTEFNLNPFTINDDVLGLKLNIKNSLFFNRGKQRYSTIYTYLDTRNKTNFSTGAQENNLSSHQLEFIHKMGKFWLLNLKGARSTNESAAERFASRNFELKNYLLNPKLSYLYSKSSRFEFFYQYKTKENQINDLETLKLHNIGANYLYSNKEQFSINTSFNLYFNDFIGNQNSAVAFQMLEGLQAGTNYIWNLSLQKKITSYLDLNINYLGRKSETSRAIHTGTIQLRASF